MPISFSLPHRQSAAAVLAVAIMLAALGCAPRVQRPERFVRAPSELTRAQQMARSRVAYERARARLPRLRRGMSVPEVEEAMGVLVAVDTSGKREHRATLLDGLLCQVDRSPLRRRWLFGYDEEAVVLVGFALEFERADTHDEWLVTRIDESPEESCPDEGAGAGPSD